MEGGYSFHERVNTILYKDDTTIILASSNYNDSRFAIKKFNWSDGFSHSNNETVYYREDYANQDGYKFFLKWWVKADNDELEATTSDQWLFDNNADNEIANNKIVGNPNDLNISIAPAIVHRQMKILFIRL